MRVHFDGEPARLFEEIVRAMPDHAQWAVSGQHGEILLARSEGDVLREIILAVNDPSEPVDVELFASRGVSERSLQFLVASAIAVCGLSLFGLWWNGAPDLMTLIAGLVLAGTLPSLVMAIGQWWIDPGRDARVEHQLGRAFRFGIASVDGVRIVSKDD